MTILCYFKISLVTFVQRIALKSMFSKKAYKSVATLLKKGVLKQHTFYVQKTTHLKVCYSSTPLGVLFACPENNTPLGVF